MDKNYYIQHNVGKARYVVNFHNGTDTHPDGSPFYQIRILKGHVKTNAYLGKLREQGYVERVALEAGQAILTRAEEKYVVKSTIEDRAACGNWPPPVNVSDYLAWIEDEAEVQEDQIDLFPSEQQERGAYLVYLKEIAQALRFLGYHPSPLPWQITPQNGA